MGWAAAGALAVALGAPTLAQAQQSGLFPLAPIRRQRTPCALEDPVYRLYRHEYFGYHPTCWRRFPAGWGCPSPEAPDPAASYRAIPPDELPEEVPNLEPGEPGFEGEPLPGMEPGPGPAGPNIPGGEPMPPLPREERSPFELDRPNNANPPALPPPARSTPEPPPADERGLPPIRDPNEPAPGRADALTPPGLTPPSPSPVPPGPGPGADTGAGAGAALDPIGDQPLLALPDPTADNTNVAPLTNDPAVAPPAQAPRRPSLLSDLFSGRVFRRR